MLRWTCSGGCPRLCITDKGVFRSPGGDIIEVEDPSALITQLLSAGHLSAAAVAEHYGRRIFRGHAGLSTTADRN